MALNNLALLLRRKGEPAAGVPLMREALRIFEASLGAAHANTAQVLSNLGEIEHEAGLPGAEATLRDALERRQKALPPGHTSIATTMSLAGHLLCERGDAAGCERLVAEALAAMRKTWPEDHPRVVQAKGYLGGALVAQRRWQEAGPLLREAQAKLRESVSTHDRRVPSNASSPPFLRGGSPPAWRGFPSDSALGV